MDERKSFIALEDIHIATPCHAAWDKMTGSDQARFCQTCAKKVYNLSDMSRSEAEALLSAKSELPCVKFYQREDGTIITDDCPVGLRFVRRPVQWLSRAAMAVAAACLAVIGGRSGLNAAQANEAKPAPKEHHKVAPPKNIPLMGIVAPRPTPHSKVKPTPQPTPPRLMGKPSIKPSHKTIGVPMLGIPAPVFQPPKPAPLPNVIHPGQASDRPHILHPNTQLAHKDK